MQYFPGSSLYMVSVRLSCLFILKRVIQSLCLVFFPLWIVGIIAPFVKPARDPTKDNRSKEDQKEELANMRKAELRWAWRCAVALLGFITLIVIAVVVGVTVANNN